ncbi:MAG: hypothetical protein KDB07_06840 [Planctomycetes bacterium]|nr:hypothetical protein [Planctomycetota bacterium]
MRDRIPSNRPKHPAHSNSTRPKAAQVDPAPRFDVRAAISNTPTCKSQALPDPNRIVKFEGALVYLLQTIYWAWAISGKGAGENEFAQTMWFIAIGIPLLVHLIYGAIYYRRRRPQSMNFVAKCSAISAVLTYLFWAGVLDCLRSAWHCIGALLVGCGAFFLCMIGIGIATLILRVLLLLPPHCKIRLWG